MAIAGAFGVGGVRSARRYAAGSQRVSAPIHGAELSGARRGSADRPSAVARTAAGALILRPEPASHAAGARDGVPAILLRAFRAGGVRARFPQPVFVG
jgi:hypothetical protein